MWLAVIVCCYKAPVGCFAGLHMHLRQLLHIACRRARCTLAPTPTVRSHTHFSPPPPLPLKQATILKQ